MPQINNGKNPPWVAGEIVTAAELNGMIDSATITPSIITDQTEGTSASDVTDYLLYADTFNGVLKKINVQNIFSSGNAIETNFISGHNIGNTTLSLGAGSQFYLTCGELMGLPNTGIEIFGNGVPVKIKSTLGGYGTASSGGLIFESAGYGMDFSTTNNGKIRFNNTSSIKLPVGTTAQRPATPVAGDTRFNSTTSSTETYNGSSWSSGYVLSEVVEETVPPTTATSVANTYVVLFTSASYTKPSNEIWRIEIVGAMQYNIYQYLGFKLKRTSGSVDLIGGWLVDQGFAGYDHCVPLNLSAVENVGTSFTSTFTFEMGYTSTGATLGVGQIVNTNPSTTFTIPATKFRIYKYKSF